MGFTTVIEPAVTPINAFMTQLELEKIPMIDKGCLAIVGNDNFLLDALNQQRGQSYIDDYVAWNVNSSKSLGLKVINAGGTELFKYKGESENFGLDDVVGAIPVHMFAGIFGTLVVPFTNGDTSFGTQLVGTISVVLFSFVPVSYTHLTLPTKRIV